MADKITPNSESSDLSQLRNLLFGEQAQQTDDRFEMLENSINALRRENRQLRQALEVEAMTRIEADESLGNAFSNALDTDINKLATIFLQQARAEQQAQNQQHQAMLSALDTLQDGQDQALAQLIEHLQGERKARKQQMAALKAQLSAENTTQNSLSEKLATMLAPYAPKYAGELNGAQESAESSSDG